MPILFCPWILALTAGFIWATARSDLVPSYCPLPRPTFLPVPMRLTLTTTDMPTSLLRPALMNRFLSVWAMAPENLRPLLSPAMTAARYGELLPPISPATATPTLLRPTMTFYMFTRGPATGLILPIWPATNCRLINLPSTIMISTTTDCRIWWSPVMTWPRGCGRIPGPSWWDIFA